MTNSTNIINNTNHLLHTDYTSDSNPITPIAQQALAQKPNLTTGLWELSKTQYFISGGAHHQFRLKINIRDYAYNRDVADYNNTVFPAIECYPEINDIDYLAGYKNQIDIVVSPDLAYTQRQEFIALLSSLGYSCHLKNHQIYLTLPNLEALQYDLQQSSFSYLKNLKIEASKGISSDQDFVESFFKSDCILSNDKEFIHDHAAHLIALLSIVVEEKENYPQLKEKLREVVKSLLYEPLLWNITQATPLNYDAMWAFLSKIVDSLQATSGADLKKAALKEGVEQFDSVAIFSIEHLAEGWGKYFKDRFPNDRLLSLKKEWYLMLAYYFASKADIPQARIDTLLKENDYPLDKISWLPQMLFFLHHNQTKIPAKDLDEFIISLGFQMDQSSRPDFLSNK